MLGALPQANAQAEEQIHARPIRPEPYADVESVKKYLNQLKSFYQMNGQRYGKRFSSSLEQPEVMQQRQSFVKRRSHKWPAIYEYIVKSWDET